LALLKTEKGWQNGTAHVNNIFSAITGYAQFILDDAPAGGAQGDYARKILAAVEMGAALAKRLALEANEGR